MLPVTAKALQLCCDAIDLTYSVVNYLEIPEGTDGKVMAAANVAMCAAGAACGGAEVAGRFKGASHKRMAQVKEVECVVRTLNIPVQMVRAAQDYSEDRLSGVGAVERGVLAPIASFARAANEQAIHQEQHYLSLTPEERAKEYRLVRVPGTDPEYPEFEKRPVLVEECERNLAKAQKNLPQAAAAEIILRSQPVETSVQIYRRLMQRLAGGVGGGGGGGVPAGLAVGPAPVVAAPVAPPVPVAPAVPAVLAPPADPFNLAARNDIPLELHQDPQLRRVTCAIMMTPVKDPVGDPDGVHIYERANIMHWLANHNTSPMTNLFLHPRMLREKPALRALINERLNFHADRLRALAALPDHTPADPIMETLVDAETPGVLVG